MRSEFGGHAEKPQAQPDKATGAAASEETHPDG
jgi:hypothetical protein